nr:MAG TPA: hypothetical protein [Caudoviricetes sp.]
MIRGRNTRSGRLRWGGGYPLGLLVFVFLCAVISVSRCLVFLLVGVLVCVCVGCVCVVAWLCVSCVRVCVLVVVCTCVRWCRSRRVLCVVG